ncbi:MAG: ATP-binding protein [Spirochaetota bacterium]
MSEERRRPVPEPRARIARILFRRAVAFGCVFIVLSVLVGVWLAYMQERGRLDRLVHHIERAELEPISESVRISDTDMMEAQLRSLARNPSVAYLAIRSSNETLAEAGEIPDGPTRSESFRLTYVYDGDTRALGSLRVVLDLRPTRRNAIGAGLLGSIYPTLAILGVALIYYVGFHRLVVKRVMRMSRYLRSVRTDYERRVLDLGDDASPSGEPDEIDEVVNAINAIRVSLNAQHTELAQAYDLAERTVEEKTHELQLTNRTLERQIAELERAKEEPTTANRARALLLGNMSHEIRTPITGVMGLSKLLLQTSLDPTQHEYVRAICDSAASLLEIVEDLLDVTKLESERIEIQYAPFDLRENVKSVVHILAPSAERQACRVSVTVADELPRRWVGDHVRIQQVLRNLLSNAVKFAPGGTVVVDVRSTEPAPSAPRRRHETIRFSVEDTGIGIPAEALPHVFEMFYQVDSSYAKSFKGTGLGLAISRRLVELMGGTIEVESSEGEGSRFSFTVPLEPVSDEALESHPGPHGEAVDAASDAAPASDGDMADGAGVLLAEDNAINRLYLERLVTEFGHSVTAVADGLGVLDALARRSYDLILMDIQMPGLDGVETTRRVRERSDVPIVALTAYARDEEVRGFIEAGMNAAVTKPVDERRLRRTIAELLRSRGA